MNAVLSSESVNNPPAVKTLAGAAFAFAAAGAIQRLEAAQIFAVDSDTRHQFRFAAALFERASKPDRGFARKRRRGVLEQPSLSRPLTLRFRPLDEFAPELDLIARQRKMDPEIGVEPKQLFNCGSESIPAGRRARRPAPALRPRQEEVGVQRARCKPMFALPGAKATVCGPVKAAGGFPGPPSGRDRTGRD